MQKLIRFSSIWVAMVGMTFATTQVRGQTNTIPSTYALPSSAADKTKPGFIWRISQVDAVGSYTQNSIARAEAQLAGLLGQNLADPNAVGIASGPATAASPTNAPIQFVIPTTINLDKAAGSNGNFQPDDQMPGAPGTNGGTDNQTAEALTWLDLPAGDITMGVNSDDGFQVTIGGSSPSDHFAFKVGVFNGSRGSADTIFKFHVSQAGLYAARLLWENGGGDSNVEWFTVNTNGTDVLINDATTSGAIKAYQSATTTNGAYASNFSPSPGDVISPNAGFNITLVDGPKALNPTSVRLSVDGAAVNAIVTRTNNQTTLTYQPASLLASASTHTGQLVYSDTGTPVQTTTNNWTFSVITYRNVVLPTPLYFENFEEVTLGGIPAGWTATNYTDNTTGTSDLTDPNSDAYLGWLVIDTNTALTVTAWGPGDSNGRVTHIAPGQIENGKLLTAADLMVGKFLYAESDQRSGNQIQYIFTQNYDLTGKSNLWVSYHSSYMQNQDNIDSLEYSIDAGTNWLPIVYMLDGPDIVTNATGAIDGYATMVAPQSDAAVYTDPVTGNSAGGYYGAFIGVSSNQWSTLGPFISARVNDDAFESHRVEIYPLPAAANQAKVQFRFAQAGTGSWYWGVDNLGIYSIASTSTNQAPTLTVARKTSAMTLTFTGTLQAADAVGGPYTTVAGATSPMDVPFSGTAKFYRTEQ